MGPVGSGGFCVAAGFDEGGRRQFGGPTWAVLDEGFHRFNELAARKTLLMDGFGDGAQKL
jgi:hypothetical protein